MTSEKKKGFLESFREVWLPRRNRNAGARGGPAEPVVVPESLPAPENNKLVSESGIRKIKEAADKKRLEHEKRMSLAAPSYNSQTNQAYAQSNSLANNSSANMGTSQAYIHSLMQAHGNGIPQMQYAFSTPPGDLVERVVSVEIDPTRTAGIYSLLIKHESGGYQFHISDAMLKTLHKKWLMARNRAEEDGAELNNSEEGESDVE